MNKTKFNATFHLLKQTLGQILGLVVLASILAFTVNHFRSDRISIIKGWSVDERFSDSEGASLVVSLEQATALFKNKAALFLDARPKDQYNEGHIKGALSLPQQDKEIYFMDIAGSLDNAADKTIITYCDGESCELSHELALFLKEMGFNNVKVLVNGWSVWQKAGLPKADR